MAYRCPDCGLEFPAGQGAWSRCRQHVIEFGHANSSDTKGLQQRCTRQAVSVAPNGGGAGHRSAKLPRREAVAPAEHPAQLQSSVQTQPVSQSTHQLSAGTEELSRMRAPIAEPTVLDLYCKGRAAVTDLTTVTDLSGAKLEKLVLGENELNDGDVFALLDRLGSMPLLKEASLDLSLIHI